MESPQNKKATPESGWLSPEHNSDFLYIRHSRLCQLFSAAVVNSTYRCPVEFFDDVPALGMPRQRIGKHLEGGGEGREEEKVQRRRQAVSPLNPFSVKKIIPVTPEKPEERS